MMWKANTLFTIYPENTCICRGHKHSVIIIFMSIPGLSTDLDT